MLGDPLELPDSGEAVVEIFADVGGGGIYGISGLVISTSGEITIAPGAQCTPTGSFANANTFCGQQANGSFNVTYQNLTANAWTGQGRVATLSLIVDGPGALLIGGLGQGSVVDAVFNEIPIVPADLLALSEGAPEPGAAVLLGLALGGLALARGLV